MPLLTVFTPVYNRAYIITKLYDSLCRQSCTDFEWLVVDDGSTDNIDELMEKFIADGKVNIRYFKQANGGKHRAINRGVREASGQMFFIVDSDDHLTDNAVEWVISKSREIIDNTDFAGISGLRIKPDGSKIGGENDFSQIDADAIEIRTRYGVTGDLAEIYKTDVLRRFAFPDFPGEKFCSEGLIWNRIAMTGARLRYCYEGIYVCEYLGDGLTAGRVRCRRESPEYSMLLYAELIRNKRSGFIGNIKYALLFWRYSEKSAKSFVEKARIIGWKYALLSIPGILIRKSKR